MRRWLGLGGLVAAMICVGAGQAADDEKKKDDKKDEPKGALAVDTDALFKKLDTNGDGKLSPEEFKKLSEELRGQVQGKLGGRALDPEKRKQLLEKFGQGGKIDPEKLQKLKERFGKKTDK